MNVLTKLFELRESLDTYEREMGFDELSEVEKLINEIALNAGIARADAEHVLQIITDTIIDSISRGEKVELNGFGSFYSKPLNASQCDFIN